VNARRFARIGALVLLAVAIVFLAIVLVAVARRDDDPVATVPATAAPTATIGVVSGVPRYASVQDIADVLGTGGLGCTQVTVSDDPLLAAREFGLCARTLDDIELRVYDGIPPAPAFEGYARSVLCPQGLDAFRYARGPNWAAFVVVDVPDDGPSTQDPEDIVSLGAVTGGEVVTVPCV
jgi:hypothetical protein